MGELIAGEHLAQFTLGAGQGTIDVNFVSNEAATPEVAAKSIGGDVSVRYLAASAPAPAEKAKIGSKQKGIK